MRIKQYEEVPDRWFVAGTIELEHGGEYSFFVLRLPSYQLMESIMTLRPEWRQLAFRYHGKHGFDFQWIPILRRYNNEERREISDPTRRT